MLMVHVKTEIWLRNKKVRNLPVRLVHPRNPCDAAGARSTLMSVFGKKEQASRQAFKAKNIQNLKLCHGMLS